MGLIRRHCHFIIRVSVWGFGKAFWFLNEVAQECLSPAGSWTSVKSCPVSPYPYLHFFFILHFVTCTWCSPGVLLAEPGLSPPSPLSVPILCHPFHDYGASPWMSLCSPCLELSTTFRLWIYLSWNRQKSHEEIISQKGDASPPSPMTL